MRPTRWTVRTAAMIQCMLKNYCVLLEVLEKISEDASGEISSKAAGLATSLEQFNTYFGLKFAHLVFSATEQMATTLQAKTMTAEICIQARDAVMAFLQRQRCSTVFDSFYDLTIVIQCITDKPKLPRCKRIPRRIDGDAENFQHETPRGYFRQQYFEVLDILLCQIQHRLKGLSILNEIEQVLINSCNGSTKNPSNEVFEMYKFVIDFDKLSIKPVVNAS